MRLWWTGVALLSLAGGAVAGEFWFAPTADHAVVFTGPDTARIWTATGLEATEVAVAPDQERIRRAFLDPGPGIRADAIRITTEFAGPMVLEPPDETDANAAIALMPRARLGSDYAVLLSDLDGGARIAIVATATVNVNVHFPETSGVVNDGTAVTSSPRSYPMTAFQTLRIHGPAAQLQGTLITSSAPIAVFVSHNSMRDQAPPMKAGGLEILVCKGEYASPKWTMDVTVMTLEPDTKVTAITSGGTATAEVPSARTALYLANQQDIVIKSDAPVQVVSTLRSDAVPPDMSYIAPVELWGSQFRLPVPGGPTGDARNHFTIGHRAGDAWTIDPLWATEQRFIGEYGCAVTDHLHSYQRQTFAASGVSLGLEMSGSRATVGGPPTNIKATAWDPCAGTGSQWIALDAVRAGDEVLLLVSDATGACAPTNYALARTNVVQGTSTNLGVVTGQKHVDTGVEPCGTYRWTVERLGLGISATSASVVMSEPDCPSAPCPTFTMPHSLVVPYETTKETTITASGAGWAADVDTFTLPVVLDGTRLSVTGAEAGTHEGLGLRLIPERDACPIVTIAMTIYVPPEGTVCPTADLDDVTGDAGVLLEHQFTIDPGTGPTTSSLTGPTAKLNSGLFQWTPPRAGTWRFELVMETEATGCPSLQAWPFSVSVASDPPGDDPCPRFLTPPTLVEGVVGEPLVIHFGVVSPASMSFEVRPHRILSGMEIDPSGALRWTPAQHQLGRSEGLRLSLVAYEPACDTTTSFAAVVNLNSSCPRIVDYPASYRVAPGNKVISWQVENPAKRDYAISFRAPPGMTATEEHSGAGLTVAISTGDASGRAAGNINVASPGCPDLDSPVYFEIDRAPAVIGPTTSAPPQARQTGEAGQAGKGVAEQPGTEPRAPSSGTAADGTTSENRTYLWALVAIPVALVIWAIARRR